MSTLYPAQIDTSVSYPIVTSQTPLSPDYFNTVRSAVIAIEQTLGVNPAAGFGTVGAGLITLQNTISSSTLSLKTGDIGGSYALPSVIGIQGYPISTQTPQSANVLTWTGTQWAPLPAQGTGGMSFVASGDLNGNNVSQKVIGIQGTPVSSASVANDGYSLVSAGGSWVPKGIPTVFNIKNFGADPTGVKDSYQAFANAIAAKEAAGGGTIFIPLGKYKISASLDLGTQPFLLKGENYHLTTTDIFGSSTWQTTDVIGTVLYFTGLTDGLVYSHNNYLHSIIKDIAIVGAGNTSTTGINITAASASNIAINNVGIFNFGNGFNPGTSEDVSYYDLYIVGCQTGILTSPINGAGPTNLCFYRTNVDMCGTAMTIGTGALLVFYGGLVQANTTGVKLLGGVREIYFDGVWFEDQGWPNSTDAGPDIVLDTTASPIANIGFFRCRLGADTTPFTTTGSNNVNFISFIDCMFGAGNLTIPASWENTVFVNGGQVQITDQSGSATIINGQDATSYVPLQVPQIKITQAAATTGVIRMPNNQAMKFRNAAGNADLNLIGTDTGNDIVIGDYNASSSYIYANGSGVVSLNAGSSSALALYSFGVRLGSNANVLYWGRETSSPQIYKEAPNTDTATTSITIQGQNAYTSASSYKNGGDLILTSGTAASGGTPGNVYLQSGTVNIATINQNKFVTNKGRRLNTTSITSSYTLQPTDDLIMVGALTAAITVTLPNSPTVGDIYTVKDSNGSASTYNITIAGNGHSIDGSSNPIILSSKYQSVQLFFNGSGWNIW